MPTEEEKLIDIGQAMPWLRKGPLPFFAERLEDALGFTRINEIHRTTEAEDCEGPDYFSRVLDMLDVRFEVPEGDLPRIPATGPVVVVSNHPFGCVDGIILCRILTQLRADTKIFGNYLLDRIPKVGRWSFDVDPFGGADAPRKNLRSMREALSHLREGGLLGTFPGGTVSHFQPGIMRVADPDWSRHIAGLVRKSGAAVVPVFFSGHNSFFFQLAGLVHPVFRTALLGRETVNKAGRKLRLRIGRPIPNSKLKGFTADDQLIRFLRVSACLMRDTENRPERDRAVRVGGVSPEDAATRLQHLVEPVSKDVLVREIDRLPAEALLLEQGDLAVYAAPAAGLPNLLREIGRLRELTFREVGEGTGKPLDLDAFDDHYSHLFLWQREEKEIVGAYRLGYTDRILRERGSSGLYTTTLFKFKPGFLEGLGPAIEMGRSFITSKYQMKHNSLSLLWKGIGHLVVGRPEYKVLFGPVSITQEYNRLSRNLLVSFMKEKLRHPRLSHFVRPSNPFRGVNLMGVSKEEVADSVRSIDDVSALISEIEEDGKGIPVLLRQYLRMSALLLSFNVDKAFSNALDGLMMADLTETDPKLLRRYMGEEGARAFLEYHAAPKDKKAGLAKAG